MANSTTSKLWPILLFAVCATLALWPALSALHLFSERYDWRYFEAMGEMSRRAVLFYHQAPLWNPYSCGGEVGLANPQSLDAAPTFLFVLLFGTAAGYKLALLLYTFLAMLGTYLIGRRFALSSIPATISALGYGLSGYMALHFSEGHVTFWGVSLFPLLLYSYDRSVDETEWIIPTGFFAAWIAVLGGTFTPPMAAELLLLWAIVSAVQRRSLVPFGLLAAAAVVALFVSAIRMFPVIEFVLDHPRPPFMRAPDRSSLFQVAQDLLTWRDFGPVPARKYWSHEYAGKLPYVMHPFWVLGIVLAVSGQLTSDRHSRAWRLVILATVGLLLSMGNFSPLAPWSLLQKLPVLRDLRVPSRHLILIILPLSLLAGIALEWLYERWQTGKLPGFAVLRAVSVLVLIACALDGIAYTAVQYRPLQKTPTGWQWDRPIFNMTAQLPERPVPFYFINGTWREMRDTFFAGHGSVAGGPVKRGYDCDEEAPLQRADTIDAGPVAQEKLLDPAAGEILDSKWSPNRRSITVALKSPTMLLLNSNWNEHWKSDLGQVTKAGGRLAVDLSMLPPGQHTIVVRYSPRSFTVGAVLTLLSFPLLFVLFFRAAKRRKTKEPS